LVCFRSGRLRRRPREYQQLEVSTDEEGKNETKTFKPGDKVYTTAQIANNGGKSM
jgi:hypothetical protein